VSPTRIHHLRPANDRYLAIHSPGASIPSNRHFFTAVKDLDRPVSAPTLAINQFGPHELRVEVRGPASGYALLVHLLVPHKATRYSDDYVDLASKEVQPLTVTNAEISLSSDMLSVGWR
jgi:hypothetical protein